MKRQLIGIVLVFPVVMFASEACTRQKPTVPATAVTTPDQTKNELVNIAGLLQPGAADQTFVITEEQALSTATPVTYHLMGHEGIDLASHVGEQVEVSGTVRAEQDMASMGESTDKDRAKGTSGT